MVRRTAGADLRQVRELEVRVLTVLVIIGLWCPAGYALYRYGRGVAKRQKRLEECECFECRYRRGEGL